jgi:hypothetical protein
MQRRSTRSSCKQFVEEERRDNNPPKRIITIERDENNDDEGEAFIKEKFVPMNLASIAKYFLIFIVVLPWISMISRNAIYSQIFPKVKSFVEESFTCPEVKCPKMTLCPKILCPTFRNITCPIVKPQNLTCNREETNKETAPPIF